MQLIDIVQLVLIGFAALIILVFFVSYFSYKARKKLQSNTGLQDSHITNVISGFELKKNLVEPKVMAEQPTTEKKIKRFEVFNPSISERNKKDSPKVNRHFPHTLFIKH